MVEAYYPAQPPQPGEVGGLERPRRDRAETVSEQTAQDLVDAMQELVQVLSRFMDYMVLDAWDRQYGGTGTTRQADPRRMRPVTTLGREPFDPDKG